jgi:arylsulfatase A-like enzyme
MLLLDEKSTISGYFIRIFGIATLVLAVFFNSAFASIERPNILWLVSEDNTTLLGCYGDPLARTPTLDKLAREGVLYESCYAQPVCAPSRFTIITGTHAASYAPAQHMRAERKIPSHLIAFPSLLKQAGYFTSNHSKTDYNAPFEMTQIWDELGDKATSFKSCVAKQPFFRIFNSFTTHEGSLFPVKGRSLNFSSTDLASVRVPSYQPDTPEIRADWARYYDQIALLDQEISVKLKELEQAGLADDTIIFYFSDNGGVLPRSKRFLQASGTRVPLLVYFPAKW